MQTLSNTERKKNLFYEKTTQGTHNVKLQLILKQFYQKFILHSHLIVQVIVMSSQVEKVTLHDDLSAHIILTLGNTAMHIS